MNPDSDDTLAKAPGKAGGLQPIVRLNYIVRLFACPVPGTFMIAQTFADERRYPVAVWVVAFLYGVVWPHAAVLIARRSRDFRAQEMRFLVLDALMIGASVPFVSFQPIPSLALLTGAASMLASVGGVPLLLIGMSAFAAGLLATASSITGFAVVGRESLFTNALGAVILFGYQTMMGLLTWSTARKFVTSRRRIAEQADEIQAQNQALLIAREEALQAAQAKAAFLATMSHEIRTPLNGVMGMTRLLADTPLTNEQQDFVRTIQVSGSTLLTVINDILDYSRIESGRLELEQEPLRVREVIEEALEIVAERARERGIELVCEVAPDVPVTILGDATRLRQVLTNLAGNAVKFTEKGEVVVTASLHAAEQDGVVELRFAVRDTGIGIPADRIPMLFTPFTQADASTTRRYGGTGLGLAISRRLTELMGGTVSVQSMPGEGSTFSFTIRAPHVDLSAAGAGRTPSVAGRRVLTVDDNATNRRVLCAQLESWGLEPRAFDNAADAIGVLAAEEKFDLAILDLHMPDVDGLMLAKRIRELPEHRAMPLILLSSSLVQSKDDPERLFSARLMKPVRQSKLFDAIVDVLAETPSLSFARTSPGLQRIEATVPLKILVADDNEINRNLARLVIRRFGYDADFACNGLEAVQRVEHAAALGEPYDLVLMDVQMPEMDGLEATRQLRQFEVVRPELRWPQIVAMTADAMPEDRGICLAAGMNDYLTKPLEFDAVRGVLEATAKRTPAAPVIPPKPTEAAAPATMDWSRLEELREYDDEHCSVVVGAIDAFTIEANARLEILRRAAADRDAQTIRSAAHALKGTALNIGAAVVAERSSQIEKAGRAGAFDGVDAAIEELATEVGHVLGELARWRIGIAGGTTEGEK